MQATISELWVYPVKSCAGVRMKTVQALRTGLAFDRQWIVVHTDSGKQVTQRSHPVMALIKAVVLNMQTLSLSYAGMEMLELAVITENNRLQNQILKTVTTWEISLPALDMGAAASAWLSLVLGTDVRLMQFDPAQKRVVRSDTFADHAHHFADGFPYLVLSQSAVDTLNERLSDRLLEKDAFTVKADRFRANIILSGVDAHTEDFSKSMRHQSGAVLHMVKPCTRCGVPNIDQATGKTHASHEPNLTLAQYRHDRAADGVIFGMNAVISQSASFAVGDVLEIELDF